MAGTQSVDSDTLRATGKSFLDSAASVEQIMSAVTGSIEALIWTGGIAEQFTEDFHGNYRPMLEQLRTDMEATREALEQKAGEYDLVFHGA
jgi:uncharacterized protein YukE